MAMAPSLDSTDAVTIKIVYKNYRVILLKYRVLGQNSAKLGAV